jgi:hypothetical protein
MKPTHKQIMKFRIGEIALCDYCNAMTNTIMINHKLYCGKCKRLRY